MVNGKSRLSTGLMTWKNSHEPALDDAAASPTASSRLNWRPRISL
jgi:hypothetical protein